MGVGFQDTGTNKSWADREGFQYDVWTDSNKTLAAYYDDNFSDGQAIPARITVVLSASGELLLEYPTSMTGNVGAHPAQVLEDCKKLFGTE